MSSAGPNRPGEDFEALLKHTKRNWPGNVHAITRAVYGRAATLPDHPYIGRPGDLSGTRELVVSRFPCIIAQDSAAGG